MKKELSATCKVLMITVLAGMFLLPVFPVLADDEKPVQQQTQAETQEQATIYGSQIMTPEERAEFSARMRAAKTNEERKRIRNEHHERMTARAKEQGVKLPDEMPEQGMGKGMGPGGGMGTGGGMGPGGGMGSGGGKR